MTFSFIGMLSFLPLRSPFCNLLQNGLQSPVIPVPPVHLLSDRMPTTTPLPFTSVLLSRLQFLHWELVLASWPLHFPFSLPGMLLIYPIPQIFCHDWLLLYIVLFSNIAFSEKPFLTTLKIASTSRHSLIHYPTLSSPKCLKLPGLILFICTFLSSLECEAVKQQGTRVLFSVIFPDHSSVGSQ